MRLGVYMKYFAIALFYMAVCGILLGQAMNSQYERCGKTAMTGEDVLAAVFFPVLVGVALSLDSDAKDSLVTNCEISEK